MERNIDRAVWVVQRATNRHQKRSLLSELLSTQKHLLPIEIEFGRRILNGEDYHTVYIELKKQYDAAIKFLNKKSFYFIEINEEYFHTKYKALEP